MYIDYKKKSANNCLGQARLLIKIITMIINYSFFPLLVLFAECFLQLTSLYILNSYSLCCATAILWIF